MKCPAVVGIVNITPDSFSGDGAMGPAALEHAMMLADAGADMLDIGAESTRPGAVTLTAAEEWARLEPFLLAARGNDVLSDVKLSIDTRHATTAAKALGLGAAVINDVGGLQDAAMGAALANERCDVVVMHALSIPADANVTLAADIDPVAEILAWKADVVARAAAWGIAEARLIFDPGIGFGKTPEQSLALMQRAGELKQSGGRWFYGHSRKSFLKLLSDAEAADRDALTLAFSVKLAEAEIDFVRVHNVQAHAALFSRLCI